MNRIAGIIVVAMAAMATSTASPCAAQGTVDGFAARWYRNGRETIPYRLFTPSGYDPQRKYPLVVWLHGAGGAGRDNLRQISGDQIPGTRTWTRPANQAKYPAFVLAPQSPGRWAELGDDTLSAPLLLVVELVDLLKSQLSIDPQRIYVAGQSDGGFGVWDVIIKRSELFAAAIPICGGGDPSRAARVARLPIWAFHGDADETIPVTASRQMVQAVTKAGGNPRYTEYKGMGHDVWTRALAEPGLVDWLFAQHR